MVREWLDRWRQKRLEREAVELLHAFDDRKLRDIGTFRDSIEIFVAEQAQDAKNGEENDKAGRRDRRICREQGWARAWREL